MNTDAAHRTAAAEAAAARWMACRDRGMSEAEHVAFATWLDADPIHAAQWRRAEAIWAELTRLDTEPTRQPSRLPHRSVAWMAMAACVILAATLLPQGGTPAPNAPTVLTIASPDGDRRVELADGSVAIMRKGSRLAFGDFTNARQVRLLQGEAHFTVSKRSPKPFFVHAGRVSVRDIGTAFFVGLASSGIQVRVTEGQVEVSAPTSPTATSQPKRQLLVEGQQATVSALSPTESDAPFIAMDVMAEAGILERAGRPIAHMEVGQPGAPAPRLVREAAMKALEDGRIGYTEALGMMSNNTPAYLRLSDGAVLGSPTSGDGFKNLVASDGGSLVPNSLLAGVALVTTAPADGASAGTTQPGAPAAPAPTGPVALSNGLPGLSTR